MAIPPYALSASRSKKALIKPFDGYPVMVITLSLAVVNHVPSA